MDAAATVIVVVGYVVAIPIMFRLRRIFLQRQSAWFSAFLAALGVIVLGHLLSGRPVAAAINAAGALLLVFAWWWTTPGRR